jgi:DNA-directed RNA polymerase specialized sigma24 family protein
MEEFESKIMTEVAKGNLSAFREIVKSYQKPLMNFVSKYVGNRTMAEDIAQEVLTVMM